ncbi:MAG TPA: hypothetical protein VHF07_00490 [Nitrospiraceae bacterium]|nr:hypothetical protein [Nitrospiraceae bacterium]
MKPAIVSSVMILCWSLMSAGGHAQPSGAPVRGGDSSGIVSGLNGEVIAVVSGEARGVRVGDRVAAAEEIRVGPGGTMELLWERRALFALEEKSRIGLQESKNGSVLVRVLEGAVRIAYSYNEGHPTDTLKVETPGATVTLRGGIIEAAVEAAEIPAQPHRTTLGQPRGIMSEAVRVIEGQAQVEPRVADAKPLLVKAGYEWQQRLPAGVNEGNVVRPSSGQGARRLAAVQQHHHVPDSTVQRVVRVHVQHALEVERALSKPRDGNELEDATGIRGAIVATSLGIPLTALSGPGTAITTATATPTIPAAPIPGSTGSPAVPSVVQPPAIPPPVIPPPVIPVPNVTALTPSQSGGINSLSLLRDVIQDISRGGNGNGRGRGRDRD